MTTKADAAVVIPKKIRSPMRILPFGVPSAGEPAPSTGGMSAATVTAVG